MKYGNKHSEFHLNTLKETSNVERKDIQYSPSAYTNIYQHAV